MPRFAAITEYLTGTGVAVQRTPERPELLDALPMTATGRIQQHLLGGCGPTAQSVCAVAVVAWLGGLFRRRGLVAVAERSAGHRPRGRPECHPMIHPGSGTSDY